MESPSHTISKPITQTAAPQPADAKGPDRPDKVLIGPPAQREMESRRSRIVSSSIGHEDGAIVITVYYDDGAAGVTKSLSWGKVYEFHPAPGAGAPAPKR